ncbi:MoaD/ThiS family protein [Novosphingobium guangzhouense]|uniref:Molybdopterin synthase sulfur carrier subunit n=1 Tax=Novosphingobium guangzhouense TaxID=1850347 RepID=A0A2K2G105_9SPHN|nr:MoaD/ThiS family protein [Novosphingobium guangzhouense]PNU04682.1 molybdopterin synthase sulfur carrier subunit [Novosphingobium guangzhouense]
MAVKLVFLGRLEELAGTDSASLDAADGLGWAALLAHLTEHYAPELAQTVAGVRVKVALNGVLIADKGGIVLANGDELAFLPPVSGG